MELHRCCREFVCDTLRSLRFEPAQAKLELCSRVRVRIVVELHLAGLTAEVVSLPLVLGEPPRCAFTDTGSAHGISRDLTLPSPRRTQPANAECGNGRPNEPLELRIGHANRFTMRSGVEHDVSMVGEALIHDNVLSIEWAKWWHRADLAVGVEALEFVLACEPEPMGVGDIFQSRYIHFERRRQHREQRMTVRDADHDLGPVTSRNLCGRSLLLCGVRDWMPEHRISRVMSIQKI